MSGDTQTLLDGRVALHRGDCIDVMAAMPENSVDAIITDPPYHLTSIVKRFGSDGASEAKEGQTGAFKRASAGFMGKQWDGGDIAFRTETWVAALRVLKPGGYILAFASTRGFARMSVAIEDAGFVVHPLIAWIFGSGFPKATRVKAKGYEGHRYGGQALKPAIEPIFMGQKPFEKGLSGTENILKWGTGALWIDGCRVGTDGGTEAINFVKKPDGRNERWDEQYVGARNEIAQIGKGRWPANVIHDGSDEVVAAFPETGISSGGKGAASQRTALGGDVYGSYSHASLGANAGGLGDSGSAARFFYSSKADKSDRAGSKHPTVKPIDLMRYLVRLVTPTNGIVLDPFAGTGTTGEAAWREGMNAVLIEREPEYQSDIVERMRLCLAGPEEKRRAITKRRGLVDDNAGPLFGGGAA
ncbi:MAG: site-specific DNA-methyltransferase [Patescibacteria group bacterium]|nr:site-specific DNA-methyltransferase [Patescibacteria group bacterium]